MRSGLKHCHVAGHVAGHGHVALQTVDVSSDALFRLKKKLLLDIVVSLLGPMTSLKKAI